MVAMVTTRKQCESLIKVQSCCEMSKYGSSDTGIYRTEDVENVINMINCLVEQVNSLKSDLEDIKAQLIIDDPNSFVVELIDSSLKSLEE